MTPTRVYIVRVGKAFKVGGSTSPLRRMREMAIHSYQEARLVLDVPGGHRGEKRLRNHFKARGLHIRGEWFWWAPRVLQQAKRILSTMDEPMAKPSGENDGLGDRMAKARVDRGMTQGQLATKLGVRQAMVSMIETGEAEYSDELGKRIKTFISSGEGPATKPARGPYKDGVSQKSRTTLPGKR